MLNYQQAKEAAAAGNPVIAILALFHPVITGELLDTLSPVVPLKVRDSLNGSTDAVAASHAVTAAAASDRTSAQ